MRRPSLLSAPAWRALLALAVVLLLGACAAPSSRVDGVAPPARAALADFALEGRFALRQGERSYSGRLSWRHVGDADEVLLSSPFGQGIAQLTANSAAARLSLNDGRVYSAASGEALTREVLGYPLPLTQLADWLRGRGAGDLVVDALGRPQHLSDAGWRIDYEYDEERSEALPVRLIAQRAEGVELRLRIDEWTALPVSPEPTPPVPDGAPASQSLPDPS